MFMAHPTASALRFGVCIFAHVNLTMFKSRRNWFRGVSAE
jgi:hypothetical protein